MKHSKYYVAVGLMALGWMTNAVADDSDHGEQPPLVRFIGQTRPEKKDVSWLGVGVSDTSEDLDAQLGLKMGEGLVVTLVASNSPAEKADLRKHDVLVEFDGQMLVDPGQLRKLVQMRAEGDEVKITFYRGGKKESVSAQIGKTNWEDADMENGETGFKLNTTTLKRDWAASQDQFNLEMKRAMEAKDQAGVEAKRAMEQARRAVEQAMRNFRMDHANVTNLGNVDLDTDATVVVAKDANSARSIVKTDETGDYVIIADPGKRLTAHDHDGKLLFDGPIETPEEQAKVPKEVWEKAKPMLDKIGTIPKEGPQSRSPDAAPHS